VLDNIGGLELLVIVLVALFLIGPDRLPKVLADVFGAVRKMRAMARNATAELSRELGTTIELEDLHPKTFIRKHLLSEAEEEALRRPFQDAYHEVRTTTDSLNIKQAPDLHKRAVAADQAADQAVAHPPKPAPTNGGKPIRTYDDAT
jgi:sec-independent protein translocase protein TatB